MMDGILNEKPAHIEQDVAPAAKSDSASELEWTVEEETRLRHKIDWYIVPLVTLLYMFTFLDRINIGNARIAGMASARELDLDRDNRFNWVLSVFYIVYLFAEVPSNIILKKVGPRFYLPLLVCAFGVVTVCIAFVKSYQGLLAARVFLGLFEGGAMPGIAFFLSCFYKRKELLFRIGIFISAASIAGAFGGLLATGLMKIPPWGTESMRMHTWRNIFFFEGLLTVICGGLAPIWMPTSPAEAWFLTPRERAVAAERLIRESAENPHEPVTMKHVVRAMLCLHNYTCALGFFLINITVQGLSVFLPTILRDLGWTETKAQLYSVPPYVAACVVAILVAYVSDKTKRRGIYLAGFAVLATIGFALLRWATDPNVRYGAVFLVTVGAFPGGPAFLSWGMNNTGGSAVRAVTSAYIVALGTLGGITATWTYVQKDSPAYHTGHEINFGGQIAVIVLSVFGILYCNWENRMRASGKRDHRVEGLSEEEIAQLGYRNPAFRYMS